MLAVLRGMPGGRSKGSSISDSNLEEGVSSRNRGEEFCQGMNTRQPSRGSRKAMNRLSATLQARSEVWSCLAVWLPRLIQNSDPQLQSISSYVYPYLSSPACLVGPY